MHAKVKLSLLVVLVALSAFVVEAASDSTSDKDQGNVCELPKVVGWCKAGLPRWYFDISTGKCTQFKYGGCGGNQNNFMNEETCLKQCGSSPVQGDTPADEDQGKACDLPKVVGRCRAAYPRWYFDTTTGKCTQFIYGGCDGNDNNFMNEEACLKRCDIQPLEVMRKE